MYIFTFKDGSKCVGKIIGDKCFDEEGFELREDLIIWCDNY